jgi:hypothetical protein
MKVPAGVPKNSTDLHISPHDFLLATVRCGGSNRSDYSRGASEVDEHNF